MSDDERPAAEPYTPPGDFTTSAFLTSPSTWLTLGTYLLPLINPFLGGADISEESQAVANLAPVVATAVLLLNRNRTKRTVIEANLELAKLRLAQLPVAQNGYVAQNGKLESRMDAVEQGLAEVVSVLQLDKRAAQVQPGDAPTTVIAGMQPLVKTRRAAPSAPDVTDWRAVAALGFGVMKTTDLAKEVFDRVTGLTPRPYLKSLLATGLAVGAAYAYEDDWRERLVLASGIAGAAAVLHEGHAVLATTADKNKVVVVERAARAAASSMSATAPGRRVQPL